MRKLPETFKKSGFDYLLIERQRNAAIYRQTKLPALWECYEVGKIRQNPAREAFGVQIEAAESWPSSEEWGRNGWTYRHLSAAKKRLGSLRGQTLKSHTLAD